MSTSPPTEPAPDAPRDDAPTEVLPPVPPLPTDAAASVAAGAPDYAAQPPYVAPAAPARDSSASDAEELFAPPAAPTEQYDGRPAGPDDRSKRLAGTGLALAIVGALLSLVGFMPIVGVGLVCALAGALILFAAFVVSIVALTSKRHGGTGLSIAALVLSIAGGIIAGFAVLIALLFTGLSAGQPAAESSTPAPTATADASAGPDQEAFLAEVRPEIEALAQQLSPGVSSAVIEENLTDDMLVLIGQSLLATGDNGIDQLVDQALGEAGGQLDGDADRLRALFEEIYAAAQEHLQ